MIVKDESHIIETTLEKLSTHITFDYWVICDTGSTDGTQDIIKSFFSKKNIPGELVQHEWRDFGHNRTLALEAAYKKADYIFIFDADDSIHGTLKLPRLDKDMYKLKFGSGFTYLRPLLLTAHKKSMFVGVLHEFLQICEAFSEGTIEGDYFVESGKTGSRSRDKDKYYKDALILKAAYQEQVKTNGPLRARYAFYCAQSYKDCGRPDDAIEWYSLVAENTGSWVQERYYACIMVGMLYREKNNFEKAVEYFLKADEFDPERKEGIVFAIEMLKDRNLHKLVLLLYEANKNYNKYPKDKLFLFQSAYFDVMEFNVSVSAFLTKNLDLSYSCAKSIVLNNVAIPGIIDRTFKNMRFHPHQLNSDTDSLELFYRLNTYIQTCDSPKEMAVLWNMLFKKNRTLLTSPCKFRQNSSKQDVIITFTSCKRLDLFTETVNSILNHWTDADQIKSWFCVDDNSSKEDRVKMKKMYPWIMFYNKTVEEKGHRESMNIIWNKLNERKPKYWIHMEDDFLFHIKRAYVADSINFLKSQTDIKQVLFNRGYAETIENLDLRGYSPLSPGFVVHDHKHGQFPYPNCHYWPHYSFRPSMVDVDTILKLGNYDSPNTFFEMDYAKKWTDAGYRSAFFDMICCRHTGRLTSERNDKSVKNAYDLNEESQFNQTMTHRDTDKFTFVQGLDQMNNDLEFNRKSIAECMEIALANPNCAGFNTLGFFKSAIDITKLQRSPYFGPNDGIYIKRVEESSKPRIKLVGMGQTPEQLIKEYSPLLSKTFSLIPTDDPDYFVIISAPRPGDFFLPERTVVFQMEPWIHDNTKNWGVKTWGEWSKPDPLKFMHVHSHDKFLNNVQWRFDIKDIPKKTGSVASIMSHKNWDIGHQLRIGFAQKTSPLVDIYGKENYHKISSYVGPVLDDNCFNVYSKYKYALAVENNAEHNYATEKIWEPLVCECLPFYWGCPNLEDHVDPQCFVRLPLEDPEKAADIIRKAIAEDWWSQRIDAIRAMKKKLIEEMGMCPVLSQIIAKSRKTSGFVITLRNSKDRVPIVEKVQADIASYGMKNEIFYGVNGADVIVSGNKIVHNQNSMKYDSKVRLNGKKMTAGEFGCAWSHIKLYQKLVVDPDNDNYLIVEDDAQLVGDITVLNDLPVTFDIAHVSLSEWYPFVKTTAVNKSFFNIEKKFFNHTTAYVVSKAGAKKLLEYTDGHINVPADDLLSNSFIKGKIEVIVPNSPVFTYNTSTDSTIDAIESR